MGTTLRAFLGVIKSLPLLTPPPGVYPRATLTVTPTALPLPHTASLMLGFWPPQSVAVRGKSLITTSAIGHLMLYVNQIREEALSQDKWKDAQGSLFPEPKRLGEVQGFPVYQGFGGDEVSGILVILPPGRALFAPVSQERFYRFALDTLEKRLQEAQPALLRAQQLYNDALSAAGKAKRAAQRAQSLDDYRKKRPRTPEQLTDRAKELERLDAEELERWRVEATFEGNRVTGWLGAERTALQARYATLSAAQKAQPAWHLPDSRLTGPHPVAPQTPGAVPIVSLARWANPALPRTAWQLLTIERYWLAAQAVRRGLDKSPSNLPYHLNKEVVEALDWQALARRFLR